MTDKNVMISDKDVKGKLRKKMRQIRDRLDEMQAQDLSLAICDHMREIPVFARAEHVFLYYPFGREVNVLPLLDEEKTFYFPKVFGKDMIFVRYDEEVTFIKSAFGILEPMGDQADRTPPEETCVIVPGLAFDSAGYRVGYGGGYYDRFLASKPGTAIGVCFDFQKIEDVPHADGDLPVEFVVTPSGWKATD